MSNVLVRGLGSFRYSFKINAIPITPAIKVPPIKPAMAPYVPNAKIGLTSKRISAVLSTDCPISITLFSSMRSRPVNTAVAALMMPFVRIIIEAIWIKGAIVDAGIVSFAETVAIIPERAKVINDKIKPKIISNTNPEATTLRISASRPSARYCAVHRTMAVFMPQSLNKPISAITFKTIPYKPYNDSPKLLAIKIVPIEEIIVERTNPQR